MAFELPRVTIRRTAGGATAKIELKGGQELPSEASEAFRKQRVREAIEKQTQALGALGLSPLLHQITELGGAEIFGAIRETERRHKKPKGVTAAKLLCKVQLGDTVRVPIHLVRPGQVQISSANIRSKMRLFVEKIEHKRQQAGGEFKAADTRLLGYEEALTAVIGPGGKYLVLTDGHHHVGALKAVQWLVDKIVGEGFAHGGRLSTGKTGEELKFVRELFGGRRGVPEIPVTIVGDLSALSEKEFWPLLAEGKGGKKLAYLKTRAGQVLPLPPAGFADLEDNPYRYLASALTAKIDFDEQKKTLKIRGAEDPVWLKIIGWSPDFIEFHIARVLEAAFAKAGLKYQAGAPIGERERAVARQALFAVKNDPDHPQHEALADVMVLTKERNKANLRRKITVEDGCLDIPRKLFRPSQRRLKRINQEAEAIRAELRKANRK